jgi:hypothetical protein
MIPSVLHTPATLATCFSNMYNLVHPKHLLLLLSLSAVLCLQIFAWLCLSHHLYLSFNITFSERASPDTSHKVAISVPITSSCQVCPTVLPVWNDCAHLYALEFLSCFPTLNVSSVGARASSNGQTTSLASRWCWAVHFARLKSERKGLQECYFCHPSLCIFGMVGI